MSTIQSFWSQHAEFLLSNKAPPTSWDDKVWIINIWAFLDLLCWFPYCHKNNYRAFPLIHMTLNPFKSQGFLELDRQSLLWDFQMIENIEWSNHTFTLVAMPQSWFTLPGIPHFSLPNSIGWGLTVSSIVVRLFVVCGTHWWHHLSPP